MKILRGKSGVSMLFVLAVMMLLLFIGVSALTAASLNYGARLEKSKRDRASLYATSMEQVIKASLEDAVTDNDKSVIDSDGDLVKMESLGGRIISESFFLWYHQYHNSSTAPELTDPINNYNYDVPYISMDPEEIFPWTIEAEAPGDDNVTYNINISASKSLENAAISHPEGLNIQIKREWSYVPPGTNEFGTEITSAKREPQELVVSGFITVVIETIYNGETIMSETIYKYSGGEIIEEFDSADQHGKMPDAEDMQLKLSEVKLEVVSHDATG